MNYTPYIAETQPRPVATEQTLADVRKAPNRFQKEQLAAAHDWPDPLIQPLRDHLAENKCDEVVPPSNGKAHHSANLPNGRGRTEDELKNTIAAAAGNEELISTAVEQVVESIHHLRNYQGIAKSTLDMLAVNADQKNAIEEALDRRNDAEKTESEPQTNEEAHAADFTPDAEHGWTGDELGNAGIAEREREEALAEQYKDRGANTQHGGDYTLKEATAMLNKESDWDDVRRIDLLVPDRFLRVRTGAEDRVHVCDERGLWKEIDYKQGTDKTTGLVANYVEDARRIALATVHEHLESTMREEQTNPQMELASRLANLNRPDEKPRLLIDDYTAWRKKLNGNQTRSIARYLCERVAGTHRHIKRIKTAHLHDFNDRFTHSVLPLGDSEHAAIHVSGTTLDNAQFAQAKFLDMGWHLPFPSRADYDSVCKNYPAVVNACKEFWLGAHKPVLERAAAWITGTHKTVDVIIGDPNVGKSLMPELLSRAFPMMFATMQAPDVLNSGSARFNAVTRELSKRCAVFADEAEKMRPDQKTGIALHGAHITAWTGWRTTVELKGIDIDVEQKRMGTAVLLSNKYPLIDLDAPGVKERLWVYIVPDNAPTYKKDDPRVKLLMSPQAAVWLRQQVFVVAASRWSQGGTWDVHDDRDIDYQTLEAQGTPKPIKALRAAFEVGEGGEVLPEDVRDVLASVMDTVPKTRGLTRLMYRAFGAGVRSAVQTKADKNGKRNRVWSGLRRKDADVGF